MVIIINGILWGSSDGSVVKNPPTNAGDVSLIPGSERFPGGGNGNPVQYSCSPIDRGAWQATVHGVTESDLTKQLSTHIALKGTPYCIKSPS